MITFLKSRINKYSLSYILKDVIANAHCQLSLFTSYGYFLPTPPVVLNWISWLWFSQMEKRENLSFSYDQFCLPYKLTNAISKFFLTKHSMIWVSPCRWSYLCFMPCLSSYPFFIKNLLTFSCLWCFTLQVGSPPPTAKSWSLSKSSWTGDASWEAKEWGEEAWGLASLWGPAGETSFFFYPPSPDIYNDCIKHPVGLILNKDF